MFRTRLVPLLFVLLSAAPAAFAADVNGLWKFRGNDQTMIFFQEGKAITVMCTYRSDGKVVTWLGHGVINANSLRYTLHHANVDDKSDYEQIFTVSADGKTMTGTYGKVGVVQGNWTLEKVGP